MHLQQLVDAAGATVEVRRPEGTEYLLAVGSEHIVSLRVLHVHGRSLVVNDLLAIRMAGYFRRPEDRLLQAGSHQIRNPRRVILVLAADRLVPLVDPRCDRPLDVGDREPVGSRHLLAPCLVLLAVAGLNLLVRLQHQLPFACVQHQNHPSKSISCSSMNRAVRKQRNARIK